MKIAFLIGAGRFPSGITPHIAGATDLTLRGTLNYIKQAIDAFAAGEKPKSVLNAPANPRRLLR
jgi:phosphoglycerate dehydrogenase-like enzyme